MIIPSIKKLIQSKPAKVLVEIIKTSTGYGRKVTIKPNPSPIHRPPSFIIIDPSTLNSDSIYNIGYWSEEEGGRFSIGALYEKTFPTQSGAEAYMAEHKIKGLVIPHSQHWTYGTAILYDSKIHKPVSGPGLSSN